MSALLAGAFLGALGGLELASASSLHVDGGVLQHWKLPVHQPEAVPVPASEPPTSEPGEALVDPDGPVEPPDEAIDSPEEPVDPNEPIEAP